MKTLYKAIFVFVLTSLSLQGMGNLAHASKIDAISVTASSQTIIHDVEIHYSRLVTPADRNDFTIYLAAIGGKVNFEGEAPVYVTLKIGGQTYTAPSDREGMYSFFVYTNNSGEFEVSAWTNDSPELVSTTGAIVQK